MTGPYHPPARCRRRPASSVAPIDHGDGRRVGEAAPGGAECETYDLSYASSVGTLGVVACEPLQFDFHGLCGRPGSDVPGVLCLPGLLRTRIDQHGDAAPTRCG